MGFAMWHWGPDCAQFVPAVIVLLNPHSTYYTAHFDLHRVHVPPARSIKHMAWCTGFLNHKTSIVFMYISGDHAYIYLLSMICLWSSHVNSSHTFISYRGSIFGMGQLMNIYIHIHKSFCIKSIYH